MKTYIILPYFLLCTMASTNMLYSQTNQENIKHIKVYYEPGMIGGWPANHGIWIWDNEILVGFTKGFYKDRGTGHNIDREKPELHLLARSLDGGESWNIEDPGKSGSGDLVVTTGWLGVLRTDVQPQELIDCKGINFKHPDFAFTARMTNSDTCAGESRYWYSYDRGHSWEGPSKLPNFGTKGTQARTDYIIDSKNECMLFITAAKSNGREGRPMCVKTTDGGKNWSFVSWIAPEPEGYSIMPASVRLSARKILVTVRRREKSGTFIAGYLSSDNGRTWSHLDNPVEDTGIGNPPAMVKMRDGRICLVYGYRAEPNSSIRAKISSDNGKTWSKDYFLRDDGSGQDIGYPRVVQRPDGKIVAVYYFEDKKTGRERYIAATIWTPPAIGEE